jgi:hypothetical protein
MKIRRLISDLSTDSVDIQILALSTIPRLSTGIKASEEGVEALRQAVINVSEGANSDIVFLARKALNHLSGFNAGQVNSAPVEAVLGNIPPLQKSETSPVTAERKPSEEANRPAGLDISGSGAPAVDDGDDEFAATVIRDGSASETFNIERQLIKEEDPRRIATLLATLATDATDVFVLNRVVGFLEHENDRVRANAVEVFEKLGNGPDHMAFLTPMLKDKNNRVRSNVVKVLGKFGHPQFKLFLSEMLDSPEISMRESGVYALCELRSLDVLDLLIKMIDDSYVDIRLRILKALANFDNPEVIDAIKTRVSDGDEVVRQHAFAILEAKGVDVERLVRDAAVTARSDSEEDFSDLSASVDDSEQQELDDSVPEEGVRTVAPSVDPVTEVSAPPKVVVPPNAAVPSVDPVTEVSAPPKVVVPPRAAVPSVDPVTEVSAPPKVVVPPRAAVPQIPPSDEKEFSNVLDSIFRELRQREQRARFSRLLFTVGTVVYELCKKSILKDVSFLAVFYEVLKYQEYVLQLTTKLAIEGGKGSNVTILKSGIDQYSSKIRDCFIKLGKEAAKEHKAGKIKLPPSKDLDAVLKMLK